MTFDGRETIGLPSDVIARQGLAYCPEERGIFASLNVEENLLLPPQVKAGGMSLDGDLRALPEPQGAPPSQGTKLSGGEQQMLAIARILRTGANLLLLDEPTEGLAPVIVQRIGEVIRTLKSRGFTILLVEQNFRFAAQGRRPPLRHGGRPRGRHDPAADVAGEHRQAASLSRGVDAMVLQHLRRSTAAAVRPAPARPDQRLVLRHAEPRPGGDLRPAERHQLRPRRAVHAGRLRGLAAADRARHPVLGRRWSWRRSSSGCSAW